MILTEEEAKTKRCQESFAAASGISEQGHSYASSWHYPPPLGSASPVHTAPRMCIGSACMAWRIHGWRVSDKSGTFPSQIFLGEPDGPDVSEGYIAERIGYCGKAGKP